MTSAAKLIQAAEGPYGLGFKGTNTARFYNIVSPKPNGEALVSMYVVRNRYATARARRKLPEIEYFEACRWDTGDATMRYRGIGPRNDYYRMAGYTVCFPEDDWEPSEYTLPYRFGGPMLIRGVRYLNGFAGTKYARAGYDWEYGLHILEFAELYRISPGVEFLAKAGLWDLMTPRFVSRLAKDRGFFEFFRAHTAEIRRGDYGLAEVNHAYSAGVGLPAAARWLEASKACRGTVPARLRKGEAPEKIAAYAKKTGISLPQYGRYLELLSLTGRHLDEFGVRYPRDFHAAFNAADDANNRRLARKKRADRAAMKRLEALEDRKIAALAAELAAISDREFGAFRVRFPVSNADLRREGNMMHNCIGGYGGRIAMRRSVCFFIVAGEGNAHKADVEVIDGRVVQCYAKGNLQPEQSVIELADAVAGLIKSRLKEAEKERNGTTTKKG